MEKIVLKKCENTFFINTRISWRKIGVKNARKKFSKNTRIGYPKIVGKKSSQKRAKKMFFNKHMNIETINGGEKSEKKKFYQKNTYIANKKRWKKILWKKCKNTFFINMRISWPKKGGKKKRENFFPETHVYCEL